MNIVPLTPQQAFDKALFGIRAQGYKASRDEYGGCFYRGPDGLKCGVGHMIPDEMYKPEFDKPPVGDSDIMSLLYTSSHYPRDWADKLRELFLGVDPTLLNSVQKAHDDVLVGDDSTLYSDEWESRMQDIARSFGLVYTAPTVQES